MIYAVETQANEKGKSMIGPTRWLAISRPGRQPATRFTVLCCALLAITAVEAGLAAGEDGHVAAKPNVVLIVADDLGYRELGSFGQKLIRTPHLDQLARQGVRLTQHYSGNAV